MGLSKKNEHCVQEGCPVMSYIIWLLDSIDGRLGYLQNRCLRDDFDKNRHSQRVHGATAKEYYQFAQKSVGTICNWLGCRNPSTMCEQLQSDLSLTITDIYASIVAPLEKRTQTDKEAEVQIDRVFNQVAGLRQRLPKLKTRARKNIEGSR